MVFLVMENTHSNQGSCHLQSEQTLFMEEGDELQALLAGEPETTLTAFFKRNREDPEA